MNTNIDLYILKSLLRFDMYVKYNSFINKDFLKDNSKELYRLLTTILIFHEEKNPDHTDLSVESLEVLYWSLYPTQSQKDKDAIQALLSRLGEIEVDPAITKEYFKTHREQAAATSIAMLSLEVANGKRSFNDLAENVLSFLDEDLSPQTEQSFVETDLFALKDQLVSGPGLKWRLGAMNKMLGPLRKGDFGFLFARPESGKTTFLASEVTYMAPQLPPEHSVVWFNNEEQGAKVMTRCYEAYFGVSSEQLFANLEFYSSQFKKDLQGKIHIYDSARIHCRDAERVCKDLSPGLIIFDQIDKIYGFDADKDRHDLELKKLYQWARELSKEYGPTIGVCQAGASGEGKKYLTMDDVDSSKTAKQGEADWILGIGKSHQEGMEQVRHLHLPKNKLLGGEETVAALRHGKMDVLIQSEIARYKDI